MKPKLMTAHYPGRCSRCHTRFPAGAPIYWSKETKAMCTKCGSGGGNGSGQSKEEIPKEETPRETMRTQPRMNATLPPATITGRDSYFTIDWSELKDYVSRAVFDRDFTSYCKRSYNQDKVKSHTTDVGSWHGFTHNSLKEWLRNGYHSEAIRGLGDFSPPLRDKRHYVYDEEGEEIFIDRVLSGEENFMGQWTKRERIPGVAVEAEIMFSSAVSARIVNAYNAWICRAVYALESSGIDCQVTLKFSSDALCRNESEKCHTIVRVKQENESTDFYAFSPMLSPAALRAFGFVAMTLHADSRGKDVAMGLGHGRPSATKWEVSWDSERRVLKIDCPYNPYSDFPEESMTQQFRDALHEMKTLG